MAAGVGQLIQATDYNSIRAVVDTVMSTGTSGYGQTSTTPSWFCSWINYSNRR